MMNAIECNNSSVVPIYVFYGYDGWAICITCGLPWYVLFTNFAASEYAPDFTIISAGFDAARGDPLGCCDVNVLTH